MAALRLSTCLDVKYKAQSINPHIQSVRISFH